MKAKSLLLTVPLAVSALLSLSLPANAVCWSWKPCADYQGGYGYGAPPTEFNPCCRLCHRGALRLQGLRPDSKVRRQRQLQAGHRKN